jgi:hypothetical protein
LQSRDVEAFCAGGEPILPHQNIFISAGEHGPFGPAAHQQGEAVGRRADLYLVPP